MCGSAVCTADDDGGDGFSEHRGEAVGELRFLSAEWPFIYSNAADFKACAGYFRCAGGTAAILCIYLHCMPVFVQDLFEACEGVIWKVKLGNL